MFDLTYFGFELGFGFPYCSRKGPQCARKIIEGYLDGMTFTGDDLIIWLDVVPNKRLGLNIFLGKCFGLWVQVPF